ncbi:MAG: family 20 glycosylhydrolase [Chloroflexi bacterium]|nr:family 20 glycosylhydrolase [Chloroflexota bacterium]
MTELQLLPQPRSLNSTGGTYHLQSDWRLVIDAPVAQDVLLTAQRVQMALRQHAGVDWSLAASEAGPARDIGGVLWLDPACDVPAQGYTLEITSNAFTVKARDAAGLYYGTCTLTQIVEQSADSLPCLHIADHPDFPVRGVMLDISRDKVPTMETLFGLVDLLAAWKINQLQLYMEHTFTYRDHLEVWEHASPLSEEEVLSLDAYCRRRFIDLVPNQNSFGHMHRWLRHAPYRSLAEIDSYPFRPWWGPHPFSVCPGDPGTLDLLRGLYDELLPNFSSRLFNIGCDETFDLGMGRSRQVCAERGGGRVYLDYLTTLCAEVRARGRTPLFWGDIILQHPELVPGLPRDALALEWGYEADHPFAAHGELFARAGLPFYVCPGTSSWNSIAGRTDNAFANLLNAAENGLRHGASGYLITDWGDHGHWQFLPFAYPGFVYGAALGWCVEANRALDVPAALDRFVFRDRAGVMGRMTCDLGNVYQSLGVKLHNASGLARILQIPSQNDDALTIIRDFESLGITNYERAMVVIAKAMRPLEKHRMACADAELIEAEFECAADMLHHACGLGIFAQEDDPKVARPLKRKLKRNMQDIIEEYRALWLERNRPGGLDDSAARLAAVLELYG